MDIRLTLTRDVKLWRISSYSFVLITSISVSCDYSEAKIISFESSCRRTTVFRPNQIQDAVRNRREMTLNYNVRRRLMVIWRKWRIDAVTLYISQVESTMVVRRHITLGLNWPVLTVTELLISMSATTWSAMFTAYCVYAALQCRHNVTF